MNETKYYHQSHAFEDFGKLDPRLLCHYKGSFDDQVGQILQNLRLTREEVEGLRQLFCDLQETLWQQWPGCIIQPFGSIVTGLGIRSSDVDCFVDIPSHFKTPGEIYVNRAKFLLMRQPYLYREAFAITTAKVPIVKFFHVPTQRQCDVNFKSPSGVRNTKLLAHLLQMNPLILKLAILVKYWSKVHNLTGTNLLPNYSLILLVIFYLQQKNILPSVCSLQQNEQSHMVDNWNTAFSEKNYKTHCDFALYDLLGEFFKFYSNYNFQEDIVSPYLGCSIKIESFKRLKEVTDIFRLYKSNLKMRLCFPFKTTTTWCVQDPFDHSRNCAVAVTPKLASKILEYFSYAREIYEHEPENRFLYFILATAPDRNLLLHNHVPNKIGKRTGKQNYKKIKQNIKNELLHGNKNNFKHGIRR